MNNYLRFLWINSNWISPHTFSLSSCLPDHMIIQGLFIQLTPLINIHYNYRGATERNRCSETNQTSHSFARVQVGYINRLQMICFSPFRMLILLTECFFSSLVTKNIDKCFAALHLPSFLRLNYDFSIAIFFFRGRTPLAQKLAESIILVAYKVTCKISYLSITWNFGDTLI